MPLIMAGPEVPAGVVCREPVSLVDGFPAITECVCLPHGLPMEMQWDDSFGEPRVFLTAPAVQN